MTETRTLEVTNYALASLVVGFVVWTVSGNLLNAIVVAIGMFAVALLAIIGRSSRRRSGGD